jgi:hypothetical protein
MEEAQERSGKCCFENLRIDGKINLIREKELDAFEGQWVSQFLKVGINFVGYTS